MKRLKRLKKANKHVLTAFQQSHDMNTKHETKTENIAYIAKNMFIAFIAFILKIVNNIKNAFIAKNAFS